MTKLTITKIHAADCKHHYWKDCSTCRYCDELTDEYVDCSFPDCSAANNDQISYGNIGEIEDED